MVRIVFSLEPFLSRLELSTGVCFLGVRGDSIRGVSIRNSVTSGDWLVARDFGGKPGGANSTLRSSGQEIAKNLRLENFRSLILIELTLNSNSRFAIRNLWHGLRDSGGSDVTGSIGRVVRLATAHRPFVGFGPPLGKQKCLCHGRRAAGRGYAPLAGAEADSDVCVII
jgi:hypothetical protein